MHFLQNISEDTIKDNILLGILANEDSLYNPLVRIPPEYEDTPELYLIQLMRTPQYFYFFYKYVLGIDIHPMHMAIMRDMWYRKFPVLIASRGWGKSFSMALYALTRACMLPDRKIVIAGAGFRQSKMVFDYIEKVFWGKSQILRSAYDLSVDGPKHGTDTWTFKLGGSVISSIPIGDGSTIRGFRAHDLINDEFASINEDIYEQVMVGFAAVSSDPLNNVRRKAFEQFMEKCGHLVKKNKVEEPAFLKTTEDNQILLSGTAYYEWNHFYKYFNRYRDILYTRGNKKKLKSLLQDEVSEDFKWDNYAIYRVPFKAIPPGFMDDESVARSKATVGSHIYAMEYDAVFSKDSMGFFRRSLIEGCTISPLNQIVHPSGDVFFKTSLRGKPDAKYVYGIDAASQRDNLAIVVLEVCPDHRRVVYVWTTRMDKYKELVKRGLAEDEEFFSYVTKKIRELDKKFPIEAIAMDAQGGGIHILESLQSPKGLKEGERRIFEIIDPTKGKQTDGIPGRHIVHMIQFANSKWTSEANHGMKKDFEDKAIVFPYHDTIEIALAFEEDLRKYGDGLDYDLVETLEGCMDEIEQLKEELSNIVHTATANGTERWDTPEIKTAGKAVGRMKKDRYSALLMANSIARKLTVVEEFQREGSIGCRLDEIEGGKSGNCYAGGVLADKLNDFYSNIE